MPQKLITMTKKELRNYSIIKNLIEKRINGTDASKQLNLSIRHVKRLKAKVIQKGPEGLIHKQRGKKGNKSYTKEKNNKIKDLLKESYYDFQPTHACEKLYEEHNIITNKETIRIMMNKLGLWIIKSRKRSNKKRHVWRARKDNFGQMQQFDGSYHEWFNNEETCLLLSIDDATGKITYAKFGRNEGVHAVFKFWWKYILNNGLPLSIYLDKFSTYKINHKNAVDNKDLMTQFQRAMNQLGVNLITAHSSQQVVELIHFVTKFPDFEANSSNNFCDLVVAKPRKFLKNLTKI